MGMSIRIDRLWYKDLNFHHLYLQSFLIRKYTVNSSIKISTLNTQGSNTAFNTKSLPRSLTATSEHILFHSYRSATVSPEQPVLWTNLSKILPVLLSTIPLTLLYRLRSVLSKIKFFKRIIFSYWNFNCKKIFEIVIFRTY